MTATPSPAPTGTPAAAPPLSPRLLPRLVDCRAALFESELPDVERALLNVGFNGLPKDDAVKLWKSARSGNVLGSIWRTVQLTAHTLDGAHRAAAVHRSGVELFAIVAANQTSIRTALAANAKSGDSDRTAPLIVAEAPDPRTVTAALCYIGYDNPGGVPCADLVPIEGRFPATTGKALTPDAWKRLSDLEIPAGAFDSVFEMVQVSCRLLPLSVNDQSPTANPAELRRDQCNVLRFDPVSRLKDPSPDKTAAAAG